MPTTDYIKFNVTITTVLNVRTETPRNQTMLSLGKTPSRNGGQLGYVVKFTRWNKSSARHLTECLLLMLPEFFQQLSPVVTLWIDGFTNLTI